MVDGGVLPEPESRISVRPRHMGGAFVVRPAGRPGAFLRPIVLCVSTARLGAADRKQIHSLQSASLYEKGRASRSQDRLDALFLLGILEREQKNSDLPLCEHYRVDQIFRCMRMERRSLPQL